MPMVEDSAVHPAIEGTDAVRIERAVPPQYPMALREAGKTGSVIASFVVDTAGRAEMATFAIARLEGDVGFARAAEHAVRQMRFAPARVHGRKVRQRVALPISFSLG